MHFTSSLLFIGLACAFSSAWAYPYPDPREIVNVQPEPLAYAPNFDVPLHRVRRKIHLTSDGGGGGQRGDGFGFGVQGHQKVWTSDNGRHEIGLNGGYGQHLGGPYGNSEPRWKVGSTYTYRFPN
ncbi:GD11418 [Drosophila simulans]|uniref:GD11418 n=1 Tax=Drosophila simulans TaxID=7240 RepID=B4QDJ8_DROSI|nr:GD11418 [Drosophila simulans]